MHRDRLDQYLDMAQRCLVDYMKQDPTDPKITNQDYLDGFIVGYVMAHKELDRDMPILNELKQKLRNLDSRT